MAIVKDYFLPSGCHIIVHDDYYKSKTPEEVEQVIDNISNIVFNELLRQQAQDKKGGC